MTDTHRKLAVKFNFDDDYRYSLLFSVFISYHALTNDAYSVVKDCAKVKK